MKHFLVDLHQTYFLTEHQYRKKVRLKHPSQVFYELDSNAYVSLLGEKRLDVEEKLSQIESRTDTIVCRLASQIKSGRNPAVTNRERLQLAEFMLTLFKRSPSIRLEHANRILAQETVRATAESLRNSGIHIPPELETKVLSSEWLIRANKEAVVRATLLHSDEVIPVLASRCLVFAVPKRPNKSFVLGGVPFARLSGNVSNGLTDPSSEIWLPVTPNLALVWLGTSIQGPIIALDDYHVRHINEVIWNQSKAAVSVSRELLISLSQSRK